MEAAQKAMESNGMEKSGSICLQMNTVPGIFIDIACIMSA